MCLAVPGGILEAEERDGNRVAKVQFGGITRQAFLNLVPEASVGIGTGAIGASKALCRTWGTNLPAARSPRC